MPRISQLPTTNFPNLDHEFPASLGGETHKLTIAQIRTLMLFDASEIAASLTTADDTTVQAFLEELRAGKVDNVELEEYYTKVAADARFLRYDASPTLSAAELLGLRKALKIGDGEFRNKIINPQFKVNQRGYGSGTALTSNAFAHDRWRAAPSVTYTYAVANGTTTINITSGVLRQTVEGILFQDDFGTYYLSWVGTAQGRINGGAWGSSGNVSAAINTDSNVVVEFQGGTLANVQLERDYVTPFRPRPRQQEIELCLRYFEWSREMVYGTHSATGTFRWGLRFLVEKRDTPAVTLLPTSTDPVTPVGIGITTVSREGFRAHTPSAPAGGFWFNWTADSEI